MKKSKACLSVVMPAFNEEETIEQIVRRVLNQPEVGELIIVDDCSTDGTAKVLSKFKGNRKIVIVRHSENMGKGAAIKTAADKVSFPFVIIQDADLEYDPSQYSKLLQPLLNDQADVVYGSRFQTGEMRRVLYFWHYIGNKFLTLLSNAGTNLNLTDMETCFKAMKSQYFKSVDLKEKRFGVEPELTAKLAAMRLRFYEVSISYFGRTYDEGKKIGARDGIRALFCIFFYNSPLEKKKARNLN